MPLEIKELHVKVVVDDQESQTESRAQSGKVAAIDENRLVEKCVEQIMQLLKDQAER